MALPAGTVLLAGFALAPLRGLLEPRAVRLWRWGAKAKSCATSASNGDGIPAPSRPSRIYLGFGARKLLTASSVARRRTGPLATRIRVAAIGALEPLEESSRGPRPFLPGYFPRVGDEPLRRAFYGIPVVDTRVLTTGVPSRASGFSDSPLDLERVARRDAEGETN